MGLVIIGGAIWDYRKRGRSRGGWISPGMGSLATDHNTFVMNSQGENLVDQTGRVWTAKSREPTPEQVAAGEGSHGPGLFTMLAGSAAMVVVALLIYWWLSSRPL